MSPVVCPWPLGRPPSPRRYRQPQIKQDLLLHRQSQTEDYSSTARANLRAFCRIFIRCFTPLAGVALVVYLFMARHKHLEPGLQNPWHMALIVFIVICFMPIGYLLTQDD
ncbi:hypothetical protein VPH35_046586 [Triticum aestivum]